MNGGIGHRGFHGDILSNMKLVTGLRSFVACSQAVRSVQKSSANNTVGALVDVSFMVRVSYWDGTNSPTT